MITKEGGNSPLICNRCGHCDNCEKRQQLNRPLNETARNVSEAKLKMSPRARNSIDVFEPAFVTEAKNKAVNQKDAVEQLRTPNSFNQSDKDKWEMLKQVTEAVIREKDTIIQGQKLKRLQLEQQVRSLEERLRAAVLAQTAHCPPSLSEQDRQLKIEERNYEEIKRSVDGLSDGNTVAKVLLEKSQLERQLGEAEHTIAEMKCDHLKLQADTRRAIAGIKSKLEISEGREGALQLRILQLTQEDESVQKELSRLQNYLADLPTKEEHELLRCQLDSARNELETKEQFIEEMSREKQELAEKHELIRTDLEETKQQVTQLLSQVSHLQVEIAQWEEREEERQSATEPDIVKLREQLCLLRTDHAKLIKLLETRQKKADAAAIQHRQEVDSLRESLERSESLADAATEECSAKEEIITRLNSTVKELRKEKQDLTEKFLIWEEKVKAAETVTSSESCELEKSVVEEIVYCASSLECLADIVQNPHQVDMATVLEKRATPVTISSPREYVRTLEQQRETLKLVSDKIETIRQIILDKYAEDMAASGSVACAMQ